MSCNFATRLVGDSSTFYPTGISERSISFKVGSLSGVSVLNVVFGCNMLININSGKINNMGPNFTSL